MWVYLTVAASSVFWQKFEIWVYRISPVHLRMIVRTMVLFALSVLLTWVNFKVARVILLLFPAVAVSASVLVLAAVWVCTDEVFYFPILAEVFLVVVQLWLSSQVLPVVCVNTHFFVVILAPWTPGCFEVENVKIWVFGLHLVQHVDGDFILGVSKSTHFSVLAILHVVRVGLTKLTFIFFGVVEFFDSIVSLETGIAIRNALIVRCSTCNFWTHLTCMRSQSSSSIFFVIMIIKTSLRIMLWLRIMLSQKRTRLCLKLR